MQILRKWLEQDRKPWFSNYWEYVIYCSYCYVKHGQKQRQQLFTLKDAHLFPDFHLLAVNPLVLMVALSHPMNASLARDLGSLEPRSWVWCGGAHYSAGGGRGGLQNWYWVSICNLTTRCH